MTSRGGRFCRACKPLSPGSGRSLPRSILRASRGARQKCNKYAVFGSLYRGHFCTSVYDWRCDSEAVFKGMAEQFAARGLSGIFADPDGNVVQLHPV